MQQPIARVILYSFIRSFVYLLIHFGIIHLHSLTDSDVSITIDEESCSPASLEAENNCYRNYMLNEIDPTLEVALGQLAKVAELEVDLEICICDGNLCNGSVRFSISVSLIVSALLVSVVSYANYIV